MSDAMNCTIGDVLKKTNLSKSNNFNLNLITFSFPGQPDGPQDRSQKVTFVLEESTLGLVWTLLNNLIFSFDFDEDVEFLKVNVENYFFSLYIL